MDGVVERGNSILLLAVKQDAALLRRLFYGLCKPSISEVLDVHNL